MNAGRRTRIFGAHKMLTKWYDRMEDPEQFDPACFQDNIESAKATFADARDEEQEYLDNMPEGIAGGEKGDKAQETIDALDNALTHLENIEFDGIDNLPRPTEEWVNMNQGYISDAMEEIDSADI